MQWIGVSSDSSPYSFASTHYPIYLIHPGCDGSSLPWCTAQLSQMIETVAIPTRCDAIRDNGLLEWEVAVDVSPFAVVLGTDV